VTQQTLVLKVGASEQQRLQQRFEEGAFEFRQVPHAVFSVKGEGVVATLYKSGKFVVQGQNPELFAARLDLGAPAATPKAAPSVCATPTVFEETTVGSDESGKGDFFGPLVVAAVRLEPASARSLLDAGVMDSKRLTDPRALRLGAWLREATHHAICSLEPAEYNRAWREHGLHSVLSRLHADAIRAVAEPGDRTVIDQFSKKDEIGPALVDLGLKIERRPRAESELAVAAASILARSEFLVRLGEIGAKHDIDFPKGAGTQVDDAGANFVRQRGMEELACVAKVHFKNTEKISRLL
jgi:ribonuclease HIII